MSDTSVRASLIGDVLVRFSRYLVLGALAVAFAVPMIWLILAPSKSDSELESLPPLAFGSWDGFATSWANLMSFRDGQVLGWVGNTLLYSAGAVLIAVLISVPAGYALALYRFPGRRFLLFATLIGMIMPTAATVLPIYREMVVLGLVNTAWAIILPSAFFPFGVYLAFLHFQSALPHELIEAAKIDGASDLRVFWSLGLPLARPAAALIAFFAFVASWNNYFLAYIMLFDDKLFNIQLGIGVLLSSAPVLSNTTGSTLPIHRPEAALAALLAVIPIAIVFIAFQRTISGNLLGGSVKG